MTIIDAHQHFWRLSRGDYDWLTPDLEPLYRDHLPAELEAICKKCGVDGTVAVQAAASEAETRYLFELANETSLIKGVVGWTDFEADDVGATIKALAHDSEGVLKGVRPMIQDIPDPDWVLSDRLDAAFHALEDSGLAFDALVKPGHLRNLHQRLLRHPNLRVVVDHAGKPDIANNKLDDWADDLAAIAAETASCVKLSGLLTEAGSRTSQSDLQPYIDHVFDVFGAERIIWGSDWPVLSLAGNYETWFSLARDLTERHGSKAQRRIFGENAREFYRL